MKFFVKRYNFSLGKRLFVASLAGFLLLFTLLGIHLSILTNAIENFKTEMAVSILMNTSKLVYDKFGSEFEEEKQTGKSWLSILDEESTPSLGFDLFADKSYEETGIKQIKDKSEQKSQNKMDDFSKLTEEVIREYGLPQSEEELDTKNLWVVDVIYGEKLISSSDPEALANGTMSINNLFRVKKDSTENNFVVEERRRGFFAGYDKVIKGFTFKDSDLTVGVGYIEKPAKIPFVALILFLVLSMLISLPFILLKFLPDKLRLYVGLAIFVIVGALVWLFYSSSIDIMVDESISYPSKIAKDILTKLQDRGFGITAPEYFDSISKPVGDIQSLGFIEKDGEYVVSPQSRDYYVSFFKNTFNVFFIVILLIGVSVFFYSAKGGLERWLNALYNYSVIYTFVIFALLLVVVLIGIPFLFTIIMSFTSLSRYLSDLNLARQYVGFLNYNEILNFNHILARVGFEWAQQSIEQSKFFVRNFGSFYDVLANTFVYTAVSVAIQLVLGITFAVILNDNKVKLRGVYQVLLILPWVIPTYISALLWREALGQYGLFKQLFDTIGLEGFNIYANSNIYFLSICFVSAWYAFPFIMVVTLSGLQGIPDSVKDAALIDGANWFTRLFSIYLPLIRPTLLPSVLLSSIWTFNNFNIVFLFTGGDDRYDILITRIYDFVSRPDLRVFTFGYAAAYSVLVFLILLIYILAFARMTRLTEKTY